MSVSDEEMIKVIGEFIEQGLVENIVSMFRQEPAYYRLTGALLQDERFMVRMGMVVLFETLKEERPDDLALAIPSLRPLLGEAAYIRGEAVTLLSIINTPEALDLIRPLADDPEPQIRELVKDGLEGSEE